MLHLYSKGCEYVFQALSEASGWRGRGEFSVKAACRSGGIPEAFTRKIFHTLVKNKILSAKTGPGGGYRFLRDPRQVSLLDIVYAVDGKNAFDKCVIKDFKCSETDFCPLHPMWMKAKAWMIKDLEQTRVANLARHPHLKKRSH